MFAAPVRVPAAIARPPPLALRTGSSSAAPVHIDVDDSESDDDTVSYTPSTDAVDVDLGGGNEQTELVHEQHQPPQQQHQSDVVERSRRDEFEAGPPAVHQPPSRTSSLPPVSRLAGFHRPPLVTTTDRTRAPTPLATQRASLDTNSLPNTTSNASPSTKFQFHRRRHTSATNTNGFKSLRADALQHTPPSKSSFKRPLVVQQQQQSNPQLRPPTGRLASHTAVGTAPASTDCVAYKSSSDSSDADDDDDRTQIIDDDTTDFVGGETTGGNSKCDGDASAISRDILSVASHAKKHKSNPRLDFFLRDTQTPFHDAIASSPLSLPPLSPVAVAIPPPNLTPRTSLTHLYATRAHVCSFAFGRCELRFRDACVELTLYERLAGDSVVWEGTIAYAHFERFRFHHGGESPHALHLALLELRTSEQGRMCFSEFFDSLVAKSAAQALRDDASAPQQLFGVAFFFDNVANFVQCTSAVKSFSALHDVRTMPIDDDEAAAYVDADAAASNNTNDSSLARLARLHRRTTVKAIGGYSTTGKRSVPAVTTYSDSNAFHHLQQSSTATATATTGGAQSIAKFFQSSNGAATTTTVPKSSRSPSPSLQQTQHHSSAVVEIDVSSSSQALFSDDKSKSNKSNTSNATSNKVPRKNATLLTYPFDDVDSGNGTGVESAAGKISITYGDIARLAPGEFLNDNIIDFYLRFLWRHQCHPDQLYVYSSHFFTQLLGSNNSNATELTSAERFARVARWTQRENDLFAKQFLFIPINDSFHWSIAVLCNPGSAIVRSRRTTRQVVVSPRGHVRPRRPISFASGDAMIVDLVDSAAADNTAVETTSPHEQPTSLSSSDWAEVREQIVDEPIEEFEALRRERPPCLLFFDSLKCHRKKKFTALLREYLASEWASRDDAMRQSDDRERLHSGIDDDDNMNIVTRFDVDAITLLEPNVPMQSNSSDCGVFVLLYAAEVARRFPGGVTREDVATHFASTLTHAMFAPDDHVREFREYVHQLLFCLHTLQRRGLREELVRDEELDRFMIDL